MCRTWRQAGNCENERGKTVRANAAKKGRRILMAKGRPAQAQPCIWPAIHSSASRAAVCWYICQSRATRAITSSNATSPPASRAQFDRMHTKGRSNRPRPARFGCRAQGGHKCVAHFHGQSFSRHRAIAPIEHERTPQRPPVGLVGIQLCDGSACLVFISKKT